MKLKVYTKRGLSLILCVVMLMTCWVFTTPGAGAADASEYAYRIEHQDANPVYHIEIDLHVLDAGNGFNHVFKGTQTGNPSGSLFWDDKNYKDMGGIVIWYKDNNGTAASENAYSIDFSPDNAITAYYHSDGSQVENNTMFPTSSSSSRDNWDNKYYTLCLDLSGFPTSYAVYNNNDHMKGNFITGYKPDTWTDFEITQIRVSGYDSSVDVKSEAYDSYRSIFTGNIRSASTDGAKCSRYYIQQDGTVSIWRPNGFGTEFEGNTDNNWVHFSDFEAGQDAMKKGGGFNAAYSKSWDMPYPQLPDYNYTKLSGDNEYFDAPEHAVLTAPYVFGKDQYGAQLAGTLTSSFVCLGEKYYDGSAWQNASFSESSYAFNNQTAELTPLKANGYQYHQFEVRPQTEWVIGGQYINVNGATNGMYYGNTKTVLMDYTPQTVIWQHYTDNSAGNTGTLQQPTTEAFYGDTPVARTDLPTAYYDNTSHHSGGYFTTAPVTEATTYTMEYTTNANHSYTYSVIAGDDTNHLVTCNCGFNVTQAHSGWTVVQDESVTYAATCTTAGQTTSECPDCHKTKIETISALGHNWVRCEDCREADVSGLNAQIPVVFECTRPGCGNYSAAEYNPSKQDYDPTGKATMDYDTAADNSPDIPTPKFNDHSENFGGQIYDYVNRYAGLRVRLSEQGSDSQAMRFSGNLDANNIVYPSEKSVGVNFDINPELIFNGNDLMSLAQIREKNAQDKGKAAEDAYYPDNTVIDFGFVFTQARYIRTAKTVIDYDLMTLDNIGTDYRIYRMSVVGNNKGKGKFSNNWKGVTAVKDEPQYTFNLVIDINKGNYQTVYCARTYVIYKYQGDILVLYDQPELGYDEEGKEVSLYSHDSVYNQALKNLAKEDPPVPAKVAEYLTDKIINNTATQRFPDYNVDYTLK